MFECGKRGFERNANLFRRLVMSASSYSTQFPTRRKQTLPEICRRPIYDMKIHIIWDVKSCRRFDVPKEGSAFFLDCFDAEVETDGLHYTVVSYFPVDRVLHSRKLGPSSPTI